MLLERQLRDLKLSQRGHGFELKGRTVIEVQRNDAVIDARLARSPAMRPEWTSSVLRNSADVRRFVDAVKQQLARWRRDE